MSEAARPEGAENGAPSEQRSTLVAEVQPLVAAWRLDRPFDYAVPDKLRGKVELGSLVRVPLGARKVRGVVRSLEEIADAPPLEPIISVVLERPVAPPPHDLTLDKLAERYVVPRGRAFERAVPPRVRVSDIPASPGPRSDMEPPSGYDGLDGLVSAIAGGGSGVWVWEVVGDEDRADLIAFLLGLVESGGALVIVPEVRYSSRLLDRLIDLDPDCIRIDSVLGPAERASGMVSLAGGSRRRIGLAGRAGVLASVAALKLIVVEEEHHPSLKEDRSPRYDARWVAVARAKAEGAVCVFLSSSPSLEATVPARSGQWGSVRPSRAAAKRSRPLVLLAEPPDAGLSSELHRAVREALRAGKKAGLLVPGAGFSRVLWCATCRRSVRCARCEAGMAFDAEAKGLRCPRCRQTQAAPDACPHCGGVDFRYLGAGSQRIAAQVERIFPKASVERVDPGVFAHRTQDAGSADIYVTTWIGTKMEVRPDVGVVGVLDADWLIHRPDFRATERAYQALSAMASWASPTGTLVIQTREPNHHCVQAIVRADHGFFVEREARIRKELGYPPFVEVVKLRSSGPAATDVLTEVRGSLDARDRVLGPIEVHLQGEPPAWEMLIKTVDAQRVAAGLRVILPQVPKGTRLRVDVDPR